MSLIFLLPTTPSILDICRALGSRPAPFYRNFEACRAGRYHRAPEAVRSDLDNDLGKVVYAPRKRG